jgi:hypothetical protein
VLLVGGSVQSRPCFPFRLIFALVGLQVYFLSRMTARFLSGSDISHRHNASSRTNGSPDDASRTGIGPRRRIVVDQSNFHHHARHCIWAARAALMGRIRDRNSHDTTRPPSHDCQSGLARPGPGPCTSRAWTMVRETMGNCQVPNSWDLLAMRGADDANAARQEAAISRATRRMTRAPAEPSARARDVTPADDAYPVERCARPRLGAGRGGSRTVRNATASWTTSSLISSKLSGPFRCSWP